MAQSLFAGMPAGLGFGCGAGGAGGGGGVGLLGMVNDNQSLFETVLALPPILKSWKLID